MAGKIICRAWILLLLILPQALYPGQASPSTAFYNEGTELFKKGDFTAAEIKFRESIKYSPSYYLPYYGMGRVCLLDSKRIGDAVSYLQKSVELDSGFAKGYFYLGLAEFIGGRNIEALHSFQSAYDRDKRLVESLYNIGVIYDNLGNSYRAFIYYRMYINETKSGEQ